MPRRCAKCEYENGPQNQFCGMCGSPLPDQRHAAATNVSVLHRESSLEESELSANLHTGPTFLDISEAPPGGRLANPESREDAVKQASYLLEEQGETITDHGRMKVALLLLVTALAVLGWHWRQGLRTWFAGMRGTTTLAVTDTNANHSAAAATGAPAVPPSYAPLTQSPSQGSPSTIPPTHEPPEEKASAAPTTSPYSAPLPTKASGDERAPASTDAATKGDEWETRSAKNPDSTTAANNTKTEAATDAESPPAPPPGVKTAKPKGDVATTAVPASPGAALAAQGEKYLYGTGVPPDCDRAKKSLLAAAQQSNSHAESVLGTMYTTGHCVGRDLPIAYRWFAKALHGDPNNQRLTDDLESLWRQMTPGEKQFALQK